MKITCVEEAKFCIGSTVVCNSEEVEETPMYLKVEHVYKSGIINDPERNGEITYFIECSKSNVASRVHIFFDTKFNRFSINSFSGPEVTLYTPFDAEEEKNKTLRKLRKALIKCWFRDITEDIKNEKSRKVSPRRIQGQSFFHR